MQKYFLIFLCFFLSTSCFSQEKDSLSIKTFRDLDLMISNSVRSDFELSKNLSLYYIEKGKKESNPQKELQGLLKYIDVCIINRKFNDFKNEVKILIDFFNKNDVTQSENGLNIQLIKENIFLAKNLQNSLEREELKTHN